MSDAVESVTQAWNHLREGHAEQALAAFETTLRSFPDDIDAHYGLGMAQQRLKHRDDAIETFNKALELIATGTKAVIGEEERAQDYVRTPEEDRFLMLTRMVNQRLDELSANS